MSGRIRTLVTATLLLAPFACAQTPVVTGKGSISGKASVTVQSNSGGGSGLPSTPGWFSIPSTAWTNLCPNAAGARPDVQGQTGCAAVVDAWAGGAADTANNILYFTGGGHHDYFGNELYALNLNTLTISTRNIASNVTGINTNTTDYETFPDGTAGSRHTYGGIAFDPTLGKLRYFGGGITGVGSLSHESWELLISCLNPASTAVGCWTHLSPTVTGGSLTNQFGDLLNFESSTGHMWLWEPFGAVQGSLWEMTSTNPVTYVLRATPGSPFNDGDMSGAIDPVNHVFYAAGHGQFTKILLTSPFTSSNVGGTGCNTAAAPLSNAYPGVTYWASDGTIVVWSGGNSILVYNPATNSCSTETYTSGPTTVGQNGTFGRFQYFPILDAAAVCNAKSENCFALRRNIVNSFANRVAGVNVPGGAASIVSSQSFDTFPSTTKQQYFQLFKPAQITTNCAIAANGCSLQIHMNPGDFQGEPGWFTYNFNSALTALYGQSSEFFVQFKARHSSAFLNPATFLNGTDFKLAIFSEGDNQASQAGNCSNTPADFVLDSDRFTLPWIYENCGGDSSTALLFLHDPFSGVQLFAPSAPGGGNFWDQPASGCPHYTGRGTSAADPTCWNFVADEWATYQVHISVGTYGTASSAVDVWACHRSRPCVLVTNAADIAISDKPPGSVTDKFGKVTLLPYATGATWQNAADVYYDDLIISNRRLPDPEQAVPNAPDSLAVSIVGGLPSLTWRVNSQNGTSQDDAGFFVERCTGTAVTCNGNPQSGYTQIGSTSPGSSGPFSDTSATSGQVLTYRVRAHNTAGNSAYAISVCFNGSSSNCGSTVTVP